MTSSDVSGKQGSRIVGLVAMVGIAALAALSHRAFGRWWARNEPWADTRVKIANTKANAYAKAENAAEWAELLTYMGLEVAAARELMRTPPDEPGGPSAG